AGPGEFQWIQSVLLTQDDSLLIFDAPNQRITWASGREQIVREENIGDKVGRNAQLLGNSPDYGTAIADHRPTYNMAAPGVNYTQDSLRIVLLSAAKLDTVM